ncbi:ester cyclase [Stutzerimonas azotifigens]|uniref:ester cyclase n=1 Tax=Stutzerimonas azotifigens TaxID=291995 RepID=UPI00041C27E7|nr:ester cyclase [Stutzerimonas azotifigens]
MSPEERKRRVQNHVDLSWNKGRLALAERLQSRYFTYKGSLFGQPMDSAGFARVVRQVRDAMPTLEVLIDECLSEGDKVVTASTLIGTLEKPLFGFQPSDRVLAVAAMSIWTLTPTGDILELNTLLDLGSVHRQLTVAPGAPVVLD